MNLDNGIPSYIIVPAFPSVVELDTSSCGCSSVSGVDSVDTGVPPPPSLQRWSSEGSKHCKCLAPPSRPRRSMERRCVSMKAQKIKDIDVRLEARRQSKSASASPEGRKSLGRWGDSQENLPARRFR
ncbi:expressed unknown protein [Seminavis robusta]|uniref:Uncharacterized protein n=1 Tax=Seminavis robusta TaxID=568900 RepID=A0A9N8HF46_9STRA|nr:expressed unknown protein [Seminavis robusta]|eukprot:Sro550_g164730.1 n/a (127) ;mRNA; r:38862-39242